MRPNATQTVRQPVSTMIFCSNPLNRTAKENKIGELTAIRTMQERQPSLEIIFIFRNAPFPSISILLKCCLELRPDLCYFGRSGIFWHTVC
jgi:hypothetical protein